MGALLGGSPVWVWVKANLKKGDLVSQTLFLGSLRSTLKEGGLPSFVPNHLIKLEFRGKVTNRATYIRVRDGSNLMMINSPTNIAKN